ncbi:hypothetical protein EDD70_0777 [Hydrogenoanaerobacterium saccharovorans]|uniref:Uncharacterized protein n=2 Tax=Hydrogenoanaerobacterium saccharovorans TaxID=474960 RepID=A0A1H8AGI6_9FIRM|nr:hypothetical protein EDD70_0777 [Hydrogenoanaerobacterium saccharovorans]SEM69606.1 hypothetical protein SAMN05216180_1314 [Hydrogenoanaerobacterium saccharovorans]
MIKALIEIDKRARQTVQTAKDKRNEAKAEIAQEKSKVHEAYLKRANEHIEKMKQHADEETSQKQLTIEEGFRVSAASLETQFVANKEKWVNEIICRCKQI